MKTVDRLRELHSLYDAADQRVKDVRRAADEAVLGYQMLKDLVDGEIEQRRQMRRLMRFHWVFVGLVASIAGLAAGAVGAGMVIWAVLNRWSMAT